MMKKIVAVTVLFIGFLLPTIVTHADENSSSNNDITVNIQAMNNIKYTTNTVSLSGSNLYSRSSLNSTRTVDTVGLRVYLQRKNRSWGNTSQSREYLNYNASSISKVTRFQLLRGYFYRVKIVHFIKNNGSYESKITYSSPVNFK
ncbi:hypothetical protein [Paraliobacillus sp. JSM ZJ581]|uniref:hypothetical protein n=1 Tax=Paraliobacillus sp. JSM ZJ581 TaxID=3342118 RepID=UPI0035A9A11D